MHLLFFFLGNHHNIIHVSSYFYSVVMTDWSTQVLIRGDRRRCNKSRESKVELGVKDSQIWVGRGGAKVKA